MKKEKYTLPTDNETGIVSEPDPILCGNTAIPIIDRDSSVKADDMMEDMPFFGPASQEEAIERIETAEKEYAKTGKAYDAFKMLEEFRKEY